MFAFRIGRRDTLAWEDAPAEFGVDEQDVLTLTARAGKTVIGNLKQLGKSE